MAESAGAAPPQPDAAAGAGQRVDFYVLPGSDARARLKLACRLAEKAYLAQQRVLVWSDDPEELSSFDELLWTFTDRSFVPHERYTDAAQWRETAVLLACPPQAVAAPDVLLNLGSAVPQAVAQAARVLEIIDAEPVRLQAGRERFRHYRDRGLAPQTHRLSADEPPP
ncbi:MAG TPA: DNA polymerase III subunit chi [Steroidobacteraceae bacterium]|nr:DNA polymerase III subunit chi [Steroidobacteraceae bacterium]